MEQLDGKSWEELLDKIEKRDSEVALEILTTTQRQDVALVLSRLNESERVWLLSLLDPAEAAELIDGVPESQAADLLGDLQPQQAGRIADELPVEHTADIFRELTASEAEEILQTMEADTADAARQSLSYPENSAGDLMVHDVLCYRDDLRIADVREDLHTQKKDFSRYHVLYIYVVDADDRLVGVMKIHDLLFAPKNTLLREVMLPDPRSIRVGEMLETISEMFSSVKLLALPVVDEADHLVGVVLPLAVEEARRKKAVRQLLWLSGFLGGEEFRSMPLYKRSGKRLSWLTLNIVLNIIAASVIALYQDTLAAVIALAVFLPMVSDMSGCSGNQAVAVSLRELSLGILRPSEIMRVAFKESSLGIVNGVILGVLLGVVAYLWKDNIYLSLVIALALAANTVVAVTMGGVLPLAIKRLKVDPALVSSPLLTTVTDMCGFFLILSLASGFLPYLS